MNKKGGGLADLFRPPLEILFKGSYDKSLAFATRSKRWLLVNVQDPGIFDCQLLNRDTWSDDGIKRIIQTSFVMIQLYATTEQASEYTYGPILEVSAVVERSVLDQVTDAILF